MPNEDEAWEKAIDKDGVVISTRPVDSTDFKEFLAETQMRGTIEKFKEILLDIERYHKWMPDCKSAEVVSMPSPDDITYHMKLKVPFPFQNRDIVQQLVLHEEENLLEIEIINRPDRVGKETKYVRMPVAKGKWEVRSISDNELSIHFQYYADPGGNIPPWLVNSFVVKNPHTILKRIREMMAP
jgi:hypothetical protein